MYLYPVFGGGLWVGEAVVAVAHEVLEGGGAILQLMGVGYVLEERLLREPANKQGATLYLVLRKSREALLFGAK